MAAICAMWSDSGPYRPNVDIDDVRRVPSTVRRVITLSHRDSYTNGTRRFTATVEFANGTCVEFLTSDERERDAFAAEFDLRAK